MDTFDYVILGGGVAGLCAAKQLLEVGISPLVIESGSYPSHKVCGEFLSPSSLPLLEKWNIYPYLLSKASFHTLSNHYNFNFSPPAGALSHLTLDKELADQIVKEGATLLTQTKVETLSPASNEKSMHVLTLSSDQTIFAKNLLIATGRIPHPSLKAPQMRYIGFKTHFSNIALDSTLYMFSFQGAYLGLCEIERGKVNIACLATIDKVKQALSPEHFIENLLLSHPVLKSLIEKGHNILGSWMQTLVPSFGKRMLPHWPNTYWIGDAASTIPPACGNGLSLAIASGCLGAEFARKKDPIGFQKAWKKYCSSQIFFGKGLHFLFLHPYLGSKTLSLCHPFPSIAQTLFKLTRH